MFNRQAHFQRVKSGKFLTAGKRVFVVTFLFGAVWLACFCCCGGAYWLLDTSLQATTGLDIDTYILYSDPEFRQEKALRDRERQRIRDSFKKPDTND